MNLTIYIPGIGTLLNNLIIENTAKASWAGAQAVWVILNLTFFIPPYTPFSITAGWTETLQNEKFAQHFYTLRFEHQTVRSLVSFLIHSALYCTSLSKLFVCVFRRLLQSVPFIIASMDLHITHEPELPICRTKDLIWSLSQIKTIHSREVTFTNYESLENPIM